MPWIKLTPLAAPQERYIPMGSIPIQHSLMGHMIGFILPQPGLGETQRVARFIERAPRILAALRYLDLATDHSRDDIQTANAWRDIRAACAGLDIETLIKEAA